MRRSLTLGFALVLGGSLCAAAIASAVSSTLPVPPLEVTLGAHISPEKLPKHEYVPVTATIFGTVKTTDGTHPSALREAVVDIDKDVKINVTGYPVCKTWQLEGHNSKAALKSCGDAAVGEGTTDVEIAAAEQDRPSPALEGPSTRYADLLQHPLLVFNGGEKGGKVTLLIHTFITVPAPTAIVTTVTIARKGTGIHSVAKIPVIAGGSGSLLDFNFNLGRVYVYKGNRVGYLEAKCPDGVFKLNVPQLLLRNEAHIPGVAATTVFKGTVATPCTPGDNGG